MDMNKLQLEAMPYLAGLRGVMAEFEPSGDRKHPAWKKIQELEESLGEPPIAATRMTAEEFLAKFPESEYRDNCLTDKGCPECGYREELSICGTIQAAMSDDGTDRDNSDFEYDDTNHCCCDSCDHDGTVADFTFDGLDELIYARDHFVLEAVSASPAAQ